MPMEVLELCWCYKPNMDALFITRPDEIMERCRCEISHAPGFPLCQEEAKRKATVYKQH